MSSRKPRGDLPTGSGHGDPIAKLIRARRESLGWSLAKLADASGIQSPSHIFHLENGQKAPSIAVARRIAAALSEDEELFAAWALVRGRSDLHSVLDASRVLSTALHGESSGKPLAGSAPRQDFEAAVIAVPLLAEGTDPDGPDATPLETITLDARLFPSLARVENVFGYRLSAHGVRRVVDLLRPGDCVIVGRDREPPTRDGLYALREGERVEIGRVATFADGTSAPSSGRDAPGGPSAAHLNAKHLVVGKVVLAFRRWL